MLKKPATTSDFLQFGFSETFKFKEDFKRFTKNMSAEFQADWENRQFIQDIQYNFMKITNFLNKFDITTRYRLSVINEKLTRLEREVQYLDASFMNLNQRKNE